MSPFIPRLSTLPSQQVKLWPELSTVPHRFVLYGGTAVALRLGHRTSLDFDFFSSEDFQPDRLDIEMPWLTAGQRLQSAPNTLTVSVDRSGPVKVSFFGGLRMGRVGDPDRAPDNGIWIASLLDLAGTKMGVLQQRAEQKDYLDAFELLRAGVSLADAIGAAGAVYGAQFNAAISLKALAFFRDGDLAGLPADVKTYLAGEAARFTEPTSVLRLSDRLAPDS